MQRALVTALFVCAGLWAEAQGAYRTGMLPQFQLTADLASAWKLNLRLEPRQIFAEGLFNETPEGYYRFERTDITAVVTRSTGLNASAGGGYMLRLQEGGPAHRFIQQYSAVFRHDVLRTGHRLIADQTLRREEPAEFRLRYRFSVEMPLSGQSVDPGEPYLKLNNEYLLLLQRNSAADLETRFVGVIGVNFSDRNKLETGIDYRANDFIHGPGDHQFWLYLGWFLALKR